MLTGWLQPATFLPIGPNAVQLWRLDLTARVGPVTPERYSSILSDAERLRAAGMRVESVRAEFVAARWLLRQLLSVTLHVEPSAILIATGKHGRPCLATPAGLDFNLSHSRGLILLGISTDGPIGVDVEFIDASFAGSPETAIIVRETLSREEAQRIEAAAPGHERDLAFYQAWTRHEAAVKADGRGIVLPAAEPSSPRFVVHQVDAGHTHCAALATASDRSGIALFDASMLFLDESTG